MDVTDVEFGSVCSGIEAASVAWHPIGWRAAWLAEIDKFASAVLAHHYPKVPNLGDMTKIARAILAGSVKAPDVFCGGTPCQAFSVAGLRNSLDDARGNLTLKFVEIANAIDHVRTGRGEDECVIVWENVPGVLSTKDNAFGCFLGGLAGADGPLEPPESRPADGKSSRHWKWDKKLQRHVASWSNAGAVYGPWRAVAWRTLDAQYFGLAQRRRRVLVVASARAGFDPAQVLFEWDGVRRDTPPSREAGQAAAGSLTASADRRGDVNDPDRGQLIEAPVHCRDVAQTITSNYGKQVDNSDTAPGPNVVAFDTTQITSAANYSNPQPGDPCHPLAAGAHPPVIAFHPTQDPISSTDGATHCMGTGSSQGGATIAVAVGTDTYNGTITGDVAATLGTQSGDGISSGPSVMQAMQVRRLTPTECERLQGFHPVVTQVRIDVCIDRQSNFALVETQCRKWQSSAWPAADSASMQPAGTAGSSSSTSQAPREPLAVLRAHMRSEAELLEFRSHGRLIWSASNVAGSSKSRPSTALASSVPEIARLVLTAANEIGVGRAASLPSIRLSLAVGSGDRCAPPSTGETVGTATDAVSDQSVERFTTSNLGHLTPTCDSILATLCCSVMAATSGCIPRETLSDSFSFEIEVATPYTAIPWRGKPAEQCPDGPRYKALGNSWAVPKFTWLGRRIDRALRTTE